MSVQGPRQQSPGDYLKAADRAFEAGHHDQGSLLLHQSVECALKQLARAAGKPAESREDLREVAKWLDRLHDRDGWHARKLRLANVFRDNAVHHFLPHDDLDQSQPSVREFVETLMSYEDKNPVDE